MRKKYKNLMFFKKYFREEKNINYISNSTNRSNQCKMPFFAP